MKRDGFGQSLKTKKLVKKENLLIRRATSVRMPQFNERSHDYTRTRSRRYDTC